MTDGTRPDVTTTRREDAMQYGLLICQGTFWGALSDLSDDGRNSLVGEYGAINETPNVTPGLPLGLPHDATTCGCRTGRH